MIDNSHITLENDITYNVIDKIKEKDFYYVYLVNENDNSDLVIRKEIIDENEVHTLVGLSSKKELEHALKLCVSKK